MYGIDPDIFDLRTMDSCDLEMDTKTIDEILNFPERLGDKVENVNEKVNLNSVTPKPEESENFFELRENVKESGVTQVGSKMFNSYVNGFGLKENLGRQRIVNPIFGNLKKEFPNLVQKELKNNFSTQNEKHMVKKELLNMKNNLTIPDYSNTSMQDNSFLSGPGSGYSVNNYNILPDVEIYDIENLDLNPKKRKSMTSTDQTDIDDFKLSPSKTPIIDAIIYCALKEEGITIESRDNTKILFKVTDYEIFYEKQKQVCSKQNPTDDESSRIKTIQRWFKNFPTKKERSKTNQTIFYFSVEKSISEDKFRKIGKIIEKLEAILFVNKRRRTK